ncbi:small ribosomal subunit protein uS10-like [Capricornis sumatraensis]|uniref:small ribosomal subunit protein uS10-like n=1 Tax=Capricornis sumatraensis TaxID=34865 RepID=UPI00360457C8
MEPVVVIHQIRITLSCNMKSLEKVSAELTGDVKENNLKLKAWVQIPTETLRITTRIQGGLGKGGSKTWNCFQARIHKQHWLAHSEIVKQITSIITESGVEVEVTIADA